MFVVECEDLRVEYGARVVLERVQFRLRPGITCLIGRNGAGKTTLFRVLSGIVRPASGQVRVLGADPFAQPLVKQAIGYLAHRPSLYPRLSVEQNLRFWARILGLDWATTAPRAARLAERFGIAGELGRRAGTLSRGQQQRVAIARLLLARPSVILLDEPATGLDALAIHDLHEQVRQLADEGVSAVYATHALDEAVRLGGQFLLLAGGSVVHLDRGVALAASGAADETTLEVLGDAELVLRDAGVAYQRAGERWIAQAHGADAVQALVTRLVAHGCRVVGIRSAARLEDRLLQRLADLG